MDDWRNLLYNLAEGRGGIWLVLLALWGGTASYLNRMRTNNTKFKLAELIGEWAISGFAGILTGYICFEMELSWPLTCFLVGVSGHMGGRAIFIFETKFRDMFGGKRND